MNSFFKRLFFVFSLLAICGTAFSVHAQKRDHLTDAEIEIVRDTQELDSRTKVLVKAAERRFVALGALTELKTSKKDQVNSDWGAEPTGTRGELLGDIAKILEEAMSKIEDVYSRDAKNALISKSLKILADAATRFQSTINSLEAKATNDQEREAVYQIKRDLADIFEAQKQAATTSNAAN